MISPSLLEQELNRSIQVIPQRSVASWRRVSGRRWFRR